MFSHLFKAAKVYLQSGRLPEHSHGRMELQTGPYCHVISHFETRFHSTLPVACGYLVVSCNVSWCINVILNRKRDSFAICALDLSGIFGYCMMLSYCVYLWCIFFIHFVSSCVGHDIRQIGLTLLPGFSALAGTADGFHSFHHRMWLSQLCNGPWRETCKRTWIGWPKILTYMGRYKHISKTSNAESSPTPTLEESFLSTSFSQRYLLLVSLVLQVASVM